jgi:hypothetical protein
MVGQRLQTVPQLEIQLSHTGEKLYGQAVDFSAPNCFSAQSKSSRKPQCHYKILIPPSLERCVLAKVCRAKACFTYFEKRVETTIIAVQNTHHVTCGAALCHISTEIAAGFVYVVIDRFA